MLLTILFAFLAGLVTVASPCILPILPIALSASASHGRSRPLGVILGLVVSFSVFTLAVSQLVALLRLPANTLRLAAVAVIALLGLFMIVPALNARLEAVFSRLPGMAPQRRGSGFGGGLLTGASLGLVWAPCAGPVLAAITTLAATRRVSTGAVAVTAAYALGVGVPLLLIAYGGRAALRKIPALSRRSFEIQRAFGVLMVLTAVLIAFNADVSLTVWATSALPADWNNRLQAFEDTPLARAQINQLVGRAPGAGAGAAAAGMGSAAVADAPGASPGQSAAQGDAAPSTLPDAGAPQRTAAPAAGQAAPATPSAGPSMEATAPPTASPPAPKPAPVLAPLDNLGPAPDFTGITGWINSPALHLADLRGKVVLVDFWTYSCINCIRTLPYVTAWYQKYHDRGLVVVGVHTPEFAFEAEKSNVEAAAARYNITYPIAQDNNYATWNAYGNLYWPAEYFIDSRGNLRHTHFGEGNYDESERVIEALLAEAGAQVDGTTALAAPVPISGAQTPETYVGLDRQERFASPEKPAEDQSQDYSLPAQLALHSFALGGKWTLTAEYALPDAAGDTLRLHFLARDVYLVLASDAPETVTVSLSGARGTNASEDVDAQGRLAVDGARLYHLVRLPALGEGTVDLHFQGPGVRVYAFTFGS